MHLHYLTAATVGLCLALAGSLAKAQTAPSPASEGKPDRPQLEFSRHGEEPTLSAGWTGALVRMADASASAGAAQAEGTAHPAVVVELYTSQGCSSCPPADEVLSQLVGRKNVIPLALHVDYWDYIGWTDKMASPAYTDRQKAYARAIGSRTIYTPQLIIDGDDRVEGARPMDVAELIQEHAAQASPVRLMVKRDGARVDISATADAALPKKVLVQLVRYLPEKTVEIERGENAGQTITYHNIVTVWKTLGTWDGAQPVSMQEAVDGPEPVVVILQEEGPGAILAAASLR